MSAPVTLTGDGDSVAVSKSTGGGGGGVGIALPWVVQSSGVSGSFSLGAVTSFGLGINRDKTALAKIATDLNVMCFRDGVEWKKLETTAGVYNWSSGYGLSVKQWFAHIADVPGRQALSGVLNAGTLYSDFQWGGPPTAPSGVVHWQNYVKSVVSNLSPLGCHNYEFWNEANVPGTGGWGGDRASYIALIKPTYDAMKSIDPKANLALAAIINPNNNSYDNGHGTPYQWLVDIAKADYSQMPDTRICYHNYYDGSQTLPQLTPEQFHAQDIQTHNTIAPFRANWETVISEVGWYTANNHYVAEDVRALYWSRYPFLLRSVPGLRIVTMWELASMTSPAYGIYDANLVAKPAAVPFGNAAAHVNAATEATHSLLTTSHLVTMKCPDTRYALWDETSSRNVTLTVNSPSTGLLNIQSIMTGANTARPLVAGQQSVPFTIGPGAQVLTATATVQLMSLSDA